MTPDQIPVLAEALRLLKAIDAKLDALLGALAEEDDDEDPGLDFDGKPNGREREPGQPL